MQCKIKTAELVLQYNIMKRRKQFSKDNNFRTSVNTLSATHYYIAIRLKLIEVRLIFELQP